MCYVVVGVQTDDAPLYVVSGADNRTVAIFDAVAYWSARGIRDVTAVHTFTAFNVGGVT